jgi:hypothetical protein
LISFISCLLIYLDDFSLGALAAQAVDTGDNQDCQNNNPRRRRQRYHLGA